MLSADSLLTTANGRRYDGDDGTRTPMNLFRELDREFAFTLDVCAIDDRLVTKFYSPASDGLVQTWTPEVCFMNPPYSNIGPWVERAVDQARLGATVVGLLPVRTCMLWFHDCVLPSAEIRFLKGRVRFVNARSTAPFASMVCIWNRSSRAARTPGFI